MKHNIYEVQEKIERVLDYTYTETEGPDCVRFDMGRRGSLWIQSNGGCYGAEQIFKTVKKACPELNLTFS